MGYIRSMALCAIVLATTSAAYGSSFLRVAHLSPDAPNVDVYLNGTRVLTDVPYTAVSEYLPVESGPTQIEVTPAGAATPVVIDATVTLAADTTYTVAATGLLSNGLSPVVIVDDVTPDPSQSLVRFVHASPDAPAVDVAVTGGPVLFSNFVFGQVAPMSIPVAPGSVDLEVRLAGLPDVVLPLPGVEFTAGTNVTVFAIGLVGDMTLTALIAPTVEPQLAQVRVAHLSPDAPNVDVFVDDVLTLADVPFRTVSDYLELPAGTYNVKVRPAGAATPVVIDADLPVPAGVTATIAASDVLASITPQVIVDDRTTDPTGARVRFAHQSPDAPAVDVGLAGGGMTLFSNFTFGQVAPDYLDLAAGTYDLEVRLAGLPDVVLPLPGVTVAEGITVTVYAVGLVADTTLDAEIVFDADSRFIRGDVNRDGSLSVGDAVGALGFVFSVGDPVVCTDAIDFDDDGHATLADVIALLSYQFAGGAAPGAPFPTLGTDPTPDDLICQ